MSFATARAVDFSELPVLDLDRRDVDALAADLRRAAIEVGFFYLKGHGIPPAVMRGAFAAAERFFALPMDRKREIAVDSRHRGFLAVGGAKMYATARPDLKESFLFGLDLPENDPDVAAGKALMGPNRWPAALPDMQAPVDAYFQAIRVCGLRLLAVFARALDLPHDFFSPLFAKPLARGALLHYPPQPPELGEDQFGVSTHTDYGALTFVAQQGVGGLQVLNRSREWVEVPPLDDALVVNIGDLMARWTNDLFVSTPHRVVNASPRTRHSIAVFFDPHFDTPIEALPACLAPGARPKYPPTTCGGHILEKFAAAFAYRQAAAPPAPANT